MGEDAQECKDCNGKGYFDRNHLGKTPTSCQTCEGDGYKYCTGPYRLADGTWSDGVERTHLIPSHEFSKENPDRIYVHTSYDPETLGKWQPLFDVWQGDAMLECEMSFDEAIAYADNLARTTKNGGES